MSVFVTRQTARIYYPTILGFRWGQSTTYYAVGSTDSWHSFILMRHEKISFVFLMALARATTTSSCSVSERKNCHRPWPRKGKLFQQYVMIANAGIPCTGTSGPTQMLHHRSHCFSSGPKESPWPPTISARTRKNRARPVGYCFGKGKSCWC
jgi:hypothetical protein